jgi:hypothetical protein
MSRCEEVEACIESQIFPLWKRGIEGGFMEDYLLKISPDPSLPKKEGYPFSLFLFTQKGKYLPNLTPRMQTAHSRL